MNRSMSRAGSDASTSSTSSMSTSKSGRTKSSCSTKCRSTCRRSPASSSPNLRRRCRTSICWRSRGACPTPTSKTHMSCSRNMIHGGFRSRRCAIGTRSSAPTSIRLNEYQKRLAEQQNILTPRSDLSVKRLAELARATRADGHGLRREVGESGRGAAGASARHHRARRIHRSRCFITTSSSKKTNSTNQFCEMMNDQRFVHDPAYRRERLAEMRERIQQGTVNEKLRAEVARRVRAGLRGQGFVRAQFVERRRLAELQRRGTLFDRPERQRRSEAVRGNQDRVGFALELSRRTRRASVRASTTRKFTWRCSFKRASTPTARAC